MGSSPQVRGTCGAAGLAYFVEGLIPAGAGNMPVGPERSLIFQAHPRRCGEHSKERLRRSWVQGSSPQVRGTCQYDIATLDAVGLIPAGAGNIASTGSPMRVARAHPRRCGEHVELVAPRTTMAGSSPQVRGTLLPA